MARNSFQKDKGVYIEKRGMVVTANGRYGGAHDK